MSLLERLEEMRREIAGMGKAMYGCRAVKYSSVRIIKSAVEEDGFQAFILVGGKGHGKSTYSIKTAAFYFMIYEGMDCGEAYLAALDRIAFTAEELLDRIEQYNPKRGVGPGYPLPLASFLSFSRTCSYVSFPSASSSRILSAFALFLGGSLAYILYTLLPRCFALFSYSIIKSMTDRLLFGMAHTIIVSSSRVCIKASLSTSS